MSRSYQTVFSPFFFFSVKLGHFTINNFFLNVTKTQAYQQKMEKFFVSKEKNLVGSTHASQILCLYFMFNFVIHPLKTF